MKKIINKIFGAFFTAIFLFNTISVFALDEFLKNDNIALLEGIQIVNSQEEILEETKTFDAEDSMLTEEVSSADVITFEGDGTKENPYLISSFDDYVALTSLVESGNDFSGKYFKQTNDIAPDEDGTYGLSENDEFAGFYDGNGYTITIAAKDAEKSTRKIKQGLFGLLSGKIINLNVEGHMVNTAKGGVFAYKIIDSGKIVNSSFNGKMRSDTSKVPFFGLASTQGYNGIAIVNCYVFGMQAGVSNNAGMSYPVTDTQGTSKYVYYSINDADKNGYGWKNESKIDTSIGTALSVTEMSSLYSILNNNIPDAALISGTLAEEYLLWDVGQSKVTSYSIASHKDEHYEPLVIELNGEGTYNSPYIISNYSDYEKLASYLKRGEKFEGKYFKQISDITVTNAEEGETVIYGLSASEEFAGIYDGNSNTIILPETHNSIAGTDVAKYGVTVLNQGLFGTLSGVVMNLNIIGRVKNISPAGVIAYKVIESGKILNCSFTGHVRNDLPGGNEYYGFASTKDYDGIAIINCFYNGVMVPSNNELNPVTDAEGTTNNSYYYITDKNSNEIDAAANGTKLSANQMMTLDKVLNENLENCALLSNVMAVDLYKWQPYLAYPVFSQEQFTNIGIIADEKTTAAKSFTFTVNTMIKKADFVKVYLDDKVVDQYLIPITENSKVEYSKVITLDASLVTAKNHTIKLELYNGEKLINTVTKTFAANSVELTNVSFTGSVAPSNTITFSANVSSYITNLERVSLAITFFDKNNQMRHFNFKEITTINSTPQPVTVSLDIASDTITQGGMVELYIWDSLGNMTIYENEFILWTDN